LDQRAHFFILLEHYLGKKSVVEILEFLAAEVASPNYPVEMRFRAFKIIKSHFNNNMNVNVANSFLEEIKNEKNGFEICRELFIIAKPFIGRSDMFLFVEAFRRHLISEEILASDRRIIYTPLRNYFNEQAPLPIEGFVFDIKKQGATHEDRLEAFKIIKDKANAGVVRDLTAYFAKDFTSNELNSSKRVLLFSLLKQYLAADTLEIALKALLRDMDLHDLSVEVRLELLASLRKYLDKNRLDQAIRTFIKDVTSPVTTLIRCVDAFRLLEGYLPPKEFNKDIVNAMIEKMHIRLLSTSERRQGLVLVESHLVHNSQKESVYEALMLGVLDAKSKLKSRVKLYVELKPSLTKGQKERAITSLFEAHNSRDVSRKKREQFIDNFEADIPKHLLAGH
jgi:hypothetical protein